MTGEVHAEMISISREDLREVVAEETRRAVERAFSEVGLYADDATERVKIRADFHHLRRWREMTDAAAGQIGRVVIMIFVGGLFAAMWVGFKIHVLKQP